jgi:hypothetical protein
VSTNVVVNEDSSADVNRVSPELLRAAVEKVHEKAKEGLNTMIDKVGTTSQMKPDFFPHGITRLAVSIEVAFSELLSVGASFEIEGPEKKG